MINKFRNFIEKDLDLKEIFMKGSSAFLVKVIGVLFSFLFTIMVGRYYGAATYGIFALCINFLLISSMFVMIGLDTTFLKYTAHYLELKQLNTVLDLFKKILLVAIPVGLFVSITLYISSDFIALHVFDKPNLGPYFRITTFMILPWSLIMILGAGLRGFKDVQTFTFLRDASAYVFGTIILFIIQRNLGINESNPEFAYLIAILITFFVAAVRFYFKIRSYEKIEEVQEAISYKKIFEVAFPLLIVFSTYHILALVNSVMLAMYGTEFDVGIYNVALRISNVTLIPLIAVNSIAGPKFAQCFANKDYEAINKIANLATKLMFIVSLPLFIICFTFPNKILVIFGPEFVGYADVLRVIILGQMINVASGSVGILMQVTNLQKQFRNIVLMTTFIIILLNYILIPQFGLIAAAYTSMANVMLVNLSCVWVVKRKYNILTLINPFNNDWRSK